MHMCDNNRYKNISVKTRFYKILKDIADNRFSFPMTMPQTIEYLLSLESKRKNQKEEDQNYSEVPSAKKK